MSGTSTELPGEQVNIVGNDDSVNRKHYISTHFLEME